MKIRMSKPSRRKQLVWYCGYKKYHCTSNLFIFRSDGLIASYAVGGYGRAGDSIIMHAANLYSKIDDVFVQFGGKVAADSAFLYRDRMRSIVKSAEDANTLRSCQTVAKAHDVTLARQTAEWGMSNLKKGSPRLCVRLNYKERGERYQIVALDAHMHNYRVNRVGLSQIHTTYSGLWDTDILDGFNALYNNM